MSRCGAEGRTHASASAMATPAPRPKEGIPRPRRGEARIRRLRRRARKLASWNWKRQMCRKPSRIGQFDIQVWTGAAAKGLRGNHCNIRNFQEFQEISSFFLASFTERPDIYFKFVNKSEIFMFPWEISLTPPPRG